MNNSPWASCLSDGKFSAAERARKLVIDSATPLIKPGGQDAYAEHMWGLLVGLAGLCLLGWKGSVQEQATALKEVVDEAFAVAAEIHEEALK